MPRTLTLDQARALPPPIVGRTLGEFEVRSAVEADSGVYRAVQRSLDREAILKVLPAGVPVAEPLVRRFLLETQLAARLDHPYAAHIYAFGAEPDGLLWIAMELVRGTPLDVFIAEQGSMAPDRFVPFLQRLAEVIDAAHEAGIVHRDIKPANVMALARAGTLFPKLLDFGVAAWLDEAAPLGGGRRVVGTPWYVAPEQWTRGAQPRPESDLYALGVLAYEALAGKPPFDGPSLEAIAEAHASAPVPPLRPDLDPVLGRALAKDPAARFPTAQAFAAALRDVVLRPDAGVPRLPEALRDAYLVRAPRPLAAAVADLDAAHDAAQALAAVERLGALAVRGVGLLAVAIRLGLRARRDDEAVRELLRGLRRRALTDGEWLDLARGLVRPHHPFRDAYPVPELLDLLSGPDVFAPLLASRGRPVDELVAAAATLLEALRFLEHYPLVVGRGEEIEEQMGLARGRRGPRPAALADGGVALLSRDGALLVELDPLVQLHRPLPAAEEQLFMLERGDGASATLVAPRAGFTIGDGTLWARLAAALDLGDEGDAAAAGPVEQSPFLGLASFSAAEAALFVGREREVETFLNRLRVQAFVGVVGPSGAGKSSFVAAGVIPALPAGWRAVVVRPGPSPLKALVARLEREGLCDESLGPALAADPEALFAALRRQAGGGAVVLVIDQFEELFTLCADEAERARYADALAAAARSAEEPLRVVITLRDDFLVRVEQLPALRDRLSQGFHLLATPEPADLMRILTEPARRAGYELDDPNLAADMVAEVASQPGALALLSFTALRLWEMRDRYFRRLTRRAYEEMGGVGGALAQHAESMLALMTQAEWGMVRQAFRRLVTAEGTRAVVPRAEMAQVLGGGAAGDKVIERLVAARLLVASDADFGGDRLELIHEALLVAWPRLVEWRRVDAEANRLREQLAEAARQWERRGRPRGLLWRDDALAEYRAWRARFATPLSDLEAAFAEASVSAADRSRRLRRMILGGAIIALTAGLLVVLASERRAERNARRAELQVALLDLEKGREALFGGDPVRAVVYLAEALRRGHDGPALRYPLASATRALTAQLVTVEHGARLWDAVFSPDGGRLVTAGDDGVVRVWDARSGALQLTLRGHRAHVQTVAFSPDGALILSAGADGRARLWDAATGAPRRELEAGPAGVRQATFTPDGKRIVAASEDGSVRIWDAAGEAPPRLVEAHERPIWSLRLDAAGQRFVTASSDRTARVFSVETGALLATMTGHEDRVLDAAFSPDGQLVATVSFDRTVRVWDAASGRPLGSSPPMAQVLEVLAFFPDGRRLVTAGGDRVVEIWSTPDLRLQTTLVGHTSYLNKIDVSPDGSLIASAGSDGTARLWDASTGQPLATMFGHVDGVWRVRFDRLGHRLVTAGHDGLARVWDTQRVDGLVLRGHGDAVQWADFSPDGTRAMTIGLDGTARIWNAADGELIAAYAFQPRTHNIPRWDAGGKKIIVFDGNSARVIELPGGRAVELPHRARVEFGVFSDDGTRALTAGADGARLWDAATGRELASYPWQAVWAGAVALSRDGKLVATVVADHDIRIIEVESGREVATLAGQSLGFTWIEFSPDGRHLVSAGQDKTAKVWDIPRRAVVMSMEAHHADVAAARFSPDGTRILTAGSDGIATVWSWASGELLLSFSTPLPLNWASFSPDGRRIIVAGDDRTARIWPIEGDTRPAGEVAEFVRCHIPFRLDGARAVRAPIDRRGCPPR